MEKTMEEAVDAKGFSVTAKGNVEWKETGQEIKEGEIVPISVQIDAEVVHKAAKKLHLEVGTYNPADYEANSVNISCDEVGVKRQTESRPAIEGKVQPKKVDNPVIHIEVKNKIDNPKANSSSSYVLNGTSVLSIFKILLGFLCMHNLLDTTVVFFADGARNLNLIISSMFSFLKVKIILDWYHLRKKMEESLSTVCNSRDYRNETLQRVMPLLWRGDLDATISVLKSMDMSKVKDKTTLDYLYSYFERVRNYIPNYMLRETLGLRNSSNRGEKSNDIIVANRQKHNGMSWSDDGSTSFASTSSVIYNQELENWINTGSLSFQLVERITPIRAKRNRKRTEESYSNSSTIKKAKSTVA
jgi:hypothetical protein